MSRASNNPRRKKRLHFWNRGTGIRLRLWMAFNVVVLSALSYGVYVLVQSNSGPSFAGFGREENKPGITERLKNGSETQAIPARDSFLDPKGKHFGVSTFEAPWSTDEIDKVAAAAGTRPTMVEYFVKWTEDFEPETVDASYRQGMLPLLAWEPWAGKKAGVDQPAYSLDSIASGEHDAYIKQFAKGVAEHKWPIALRFAHEMNGDWYPWSEKRSGNKPGDYVKAWRHVHQLFDEAGADNVIWLWSPNILRPVPDVSLKALYPGKKYVDWVGMVGYAVEDKTASQVFDATLKALRKFTDQPVLITETGAQPGSRKAPWTSDFFTWLAKNPDVIGFVWFERSEEEGGGADWRFTSDAATTRAFKSGIGGIDLVSAAAGTSD
ncbi:glycoside hydrolase family 26 protein [Streptomyces sp. NPDC091292]|uniref:glycoside hydrolase family 26 protein n=1 Tax=Streptomyces sp. NPDC091292 TaxID=3365991 RepID=UPI00382E48E1